MNIWYFGNLAGIDFSSGTPAVLSNSAMFAQEGCAVLCDSAGNLLFYTNGQLVYDATHTQMPNGDSLWGSMSTTQSSIIIPKPCAPGIHYIFTADGGTSGFPFGGFAAYSEVDMSRNGGLGDVTIRNVPLYDTTCEKLCAVRHSNKRDVWVISHKWDSDAFYAYLVSPAGVTGPVISNVGAVHTVSTSFAGQMKGSPDGSMVAMVATWPVNACEVFDFDNSTGVLSNVISMTSHSSPYGVEFSPNGSQLYVAEIGSSNLYQYNLLAGTPAAIIASQTTIATASGIYALQLANNGKIYAARANVTWVGVINSPNTLGVAANYVHNGFSLGVNDCRAGLPAFINNYDSAYLALGPGFSIQVSGTCLGDSTYFALTNGALADSVKWDFDDGNFSTSVNPAHLYSAAGTYNITARVWNSCVGIDTVGYTITILTLPLLDLGNDTSLCQGSSLALDASGITGSYLWSTGDTLPSLTISSTGFYRLEISHICGLIADSIQVNFLDIPLYLGSDTTLCPGDVIALDLTGTGTSYLWQDGSTGSLMNISSAGLYWAEVSDGVCTERDSITVTMLTKPVVALGPDTLICLKDIVTLAANPAGLNYRWSTGASAGQINVGIAGDYWGIGTDASGCSSDTAWQEVEVEICLLPCRGGESIYIPNAFTPGEADNSIFYIRGNSDVKIRVLQIFDRWGEVVFEAREKVINDRSAGWDGTYKGRQLEPQVFAYYLKAECGGKEEIVKSGNITLIR